VLIRFITYKDVDGVEQTEKFYFNLDAPEFATFIARFENLEDISAETVRTADLKSLVIRMEDFKDLILASYGLRSEDGKRFIKSDEIRLEFSQHRAFATLFHEITNDENALDKFFKGVLPDDMQVDLSTQTIQATIADIKEVKDVQLPPAPPVVPEE
jgi:Fe-S-cluster formation regulator IscX/YfhJ